MEKETNNTSNFGFTDDECQLMFRHFNPKARQMMNKEVFLSELKETYTNGYDFDWNSFEEKIMSIPQNDFNRLIKYFMIEWESFLEFIYAFYPENWWEELNNQKN